MNVSRDRFADRGLPAAGSAQDRSIGAILIDQGKLTPEGAETALQFARARAGRFGDAAVELGLVTAADVQHALALQFGYSYLAAGDESLSPELVAAFEPFHKQVEALRAVRTQLMLRWFGEAPDRRTLAIVSPRRGEGRSFVAANLAIAFAQLGERTLLVDADLRQPRQHELFRVSDQVGLSSILAGRANGDAVHAIASLPGLAVLPAGPIPPNPQELLSRPAFGDVLGELAQRFDVILVDTPAAAENSDARIIAFRTRAAMFVSRQNVTRLAELRGLMAQLGESGCTVVGGVINRL